MKTKQFRLLPEEPLYDENGSTPIQVRPIVAPDGKTIVCRVNIHYADAATRDTCEARAQLIVAALNAAHAAER